MRTMIDGVLEHAKTLHALPGYSSSTTIAMLELEDVPESVVAGNLYMTALNIIARLMWPKEIEVPAERLEILE